MGRGEGLNLTLKFSRKKNIGAASYKIKNESTNPTSPTFQMKMGSNDTEDSRLQILVRAT